MLSCIFIFVLYETRISSGRLVISEFIYGESVRNLQIFDESSFDNAGEQVYIPSMPLRI